MKPILIRRSLFVFMVAFTSAFVLLAAFSSADDEHDDGEHHGNSRTFTVLVGAEGTTSNGSSFALTSTVVVLLLGMFLFARTEYVTAD